MSKRCPKNIRGMIFAVIGIFAALGCVCYLQIYNQLVKTKWGQKMAFGTIVLIDVVWLLMLLFFIAIGKYGAPAVGCDDGEDQELLQLRGPEAGGGSYGDIPKEFQGGIEFETKNEPHNRRMLDADEQYEKSQRSGSINPKIVKKSKKGSLNEDLLDDQEEDYDYGGAGW